ncbi:hypothetical protein BOTBODRAFT_301035 [Botryobasidium botryosum FD-172 SS1]|uniref:Uncharacterized protein n=1 Tax=Botryobasidium botryosum (strain FD-172 SS1) TaxID=930990 RepID=A0A067MU00_BOTB1|nr:hypothetical protein BOTBODRAFT_301035 [Botryobasidium botryosum FD-172 SS1]
MTAFLSRPNSLLARALWSVWRSTPRLFRMLLYKLMTRLGEALYGRKSASRYRLPFGLYAKYGRNVTKTEALANVYVESHTMIPVPRVLNLLEDNKGVFILSPHLPGEPFLDTFRRRTLSAADIARNEDTLRDWFAQLRALLSSRSMRVRVWRWPLQELPGPFSVRLTLRATSTNTCTKVHPWKNGTVCTPSPYRRTPDSIKYTSPTAILRPPISSFPIIA